MSRPIAGEAVDEALLETCVCALARAGVRETRAKRVNGTV